MCRHLITRMQLHFFFAADAECELNCKPIRLNYFATLNKTVIDGTSCSKPPEFYRKSYEGRAVCVEGTCKVSVVYIHWLY